MITPQAIRLLDDSTEVKGKSPSKLLSTAPLELKSGEWHKLHYEWNGDRMAATLDDVKVEATNPNLGLKKSRWWFAVGGASLKIRNIAVAGVKP